MANIFKMKLIQLLIVFFSFQNYCDLCKAIQIASYSNYADANKVVKNLNSLIPSVYTTVAVVNNQKWYRIRVKGFKNQADIKKFSNFFDFNDAFVINDKCKSKQFNIYIDTLYIGEYELGDLGDVLLYKSIYHPVFGVLVNSHPKISYKKNRLKDLHIFENNNGVSKYENIIGFTENKESFTYCQALNVYIDHEGENKEKFFDDIKEFSKRYNIELKSVENSLYIYEKEDYNVALCQLCHDKNLVTFKSNRVEPTEQILMSGEEVLKTIKMRFSDSKINSSFAEGVEKYADNLIYIKSNFGTLIIKKLNFVSIEICTIFGDGK